jgi:hypothetical protein
VGLRIKKKTYNEIKHIQAFVKRVIGLLKKVEAMKEETSKKGVSRLKKETTKDMVTRWSEGGQGCFKDIRTWRK